MSKKLRNYRCFAAFSSGGSASNLPPESSPWDIPGISPPTNPLFRPCPCSANQLSVRSMGFWKKDAIRRKLMTPAEQEDFLRTYGEAARPMLEAVLDERVEELAARYEKAWGGIFAHMRDEHEGVPMVSRRKAAEMLGVSLSTIQRLEERGELPPP